MTRRRLALGGLLLLVLLGGCLGSAEIPEEQLTENATYDWEQNATVALDLGPSAYTTVVNVTNQSTLKIYERDSLGTETPVDISALKFRYPNGTVVNATQANLSATLASKRTEISLPAKFGKVGFTAERNGKTFAMPVFEKGSYLVRLPEGTRIGVPLLSSASPGGYETTVENDRMEIRWQNVEDGSISVRYYLQRDLLIFGSIVVIGLSLGIGGSLYYLRQIRRLEDQREELGLDVDYEDDPGDDGPPPGMR